MRHSVQRWLLCAGAVAAVAASGCLQVGAASAAQAATVASSAPAATAYVPPGRNLYFGDSGPAVGSVQWRLNQLGYYAGPDNGRYGTDLEEAVWAFKEVQGLPMNAATNSVITRAFRHDLINPRAPRVLKANGGANRVEINQNIQVLVLYRNNAPYLILHVSTGGGYTYPCPGHSGETCGPAITPDGNYTANWFASGWQQVPLGTMYNPVFFIGGSYAIHGDIPVPWYPASHGCVRIWMDAATWFHKDLRIGGLHPTPIYIRGTAPYYL
jgi:peptidoglycan hydrolase-like protein with peptidoglycan-binding domain